MDQAEELTTGEKKAVAVSDQLEGNTVAVFDQHGNVEKKRKVDFSKWHNSFAEYASTICDGPTPISPKCVRCKNREILCANVPKKKQ